MLAGLILQMLPRQGYNDISKTSEYFSGKTIASGVSSRGLSRLGGQAVPGPGARWVCLPALEPLWLCPPSTWRDLHFPGTGDGRGLPLRGPLGLRGQRGAGGLETTKIKEREKPSFKKRRVQRA